MSPEPQQIVIQLCDDSRLRPAPAFAFLGFSALRFMVAVITAFVFVLAADLEDAPDSSTGSLECGEPPAESVSFFIGNHTLLASCGLELSAKSKSRRAQAFLEHTSDLEVREVRYVTSDLALARMLLKEARDLPPAPTGRPALHVHPQSLNPSRKKAIAGVR